MSGQIALDLLDFFFCKKSDWYTGLVNLTFLLLVRRSIDVEKGEVMALIGEVAGPLFIDILEDVCEFRCDVGHILLIEVDNVIFFLYHFEEVSYLCHCLFVERLLYLVEIVAFVD